MSLETLCVLFLVVFVLVSILSYRIQLGKHLKGGWQNTYEGKTYNIRIWPGRNQINGFTIWIENTNFPEFSFVKRNFLQNLFRVSGSAVNFSGEDAFLKLVYVCSDNRELQREMAANPRLRNFVAEIFKSGKDANFILQECRSRHNTLSLYFRPAVIKEKGVLRLPNSAGQTEEASLKFLEQFASQLFKLAELLQPLSTNTVLGGEDPGLRRAILIQALTLAWAASGAFLHLSALVSTHATVILPGKLIWYVAPRAGLVYVFLLAVTFIVVRGSAHFYKAFLLFVTLGLCGTFLNTFAGCYAVNVKLDTSVAVAHEMRVAYKTKSDSGRSQEYVLHLYCAGPDSLQVTKIEVGKTRYEETEPGQEVILQVKSGYLGFPWIQSAQFRK